MAVTELAAMNSQRNALEKKNMKNERHTKNATDCDGNEI